MGAQVPKVLLPVAGRPLASYVIDAARAAGADRIILVVGTGKEQVKSTLAGERVEFVEQREQKGTADAVLACRDMIADTEECVVLCGDAPLVRPETIRRISRAPRETGARIAVFTARPDDPSGYGRIIRAGGSFVERIVEQRDATPEVLAVKEVNSGAYAFRWGDVRPALGRIKPSRVSGEYYLTDVVALVRAEGGSVVAVEAADPNEMLGANTPGQLDEIAAELARRRGDSHQ